MTRFIGIILNILFLFAMYASGVGMQYGDNLLNVIGSLYFIGTMIMVVLLGILFFLPFSIEVSALEQFKKLESSLKIKWTSALFYLIGIPLAAWFGHFRVLGLILFSLVITVALRVVVGAVVKVYSDE